MNGNLKDIERVLDLLGRKIPLQLNEFRTYSDRKTGLTMALGFDEEHEFAVTLPAWAWRIIKDNYERSSRSESDGPKHAANDSVYRPVNEQTARGPVPRDNARLNDA